MSRVLAIAGKVAGVVAAVASVIPGGQGIAAIAGVAAAPTSIGFELPERPVTAIQLFHDGRRAYITTDGVGVDPIAGHIVDLRVKAHAWPDRNLAIAISGNGTVKHLADAVEAVAPNARQGDMLKAMPEALRLMNANVQRDIDTEPSGVRGTQRLYIAAYDRVRSKPRLYAITSDPDVTAPEAVPYIMREIKGGYVNGLTPEGVQAALPYGYITAPKADACRLLAAQRHFRLEQGYYGVGGTCQMFTVSRRGVTVEPIMQYPEGLGQTINPALPGVVVGRLAA